MDMYFDEEIGSISIIGENTENIPMWTINHYFKTYCDNYVKLILLTRLCRLYQRGMRLDEIVISAKSIPVSSDKNSIDKFMYCNKNVVEYVAKEEEPNKFWDIFNRCERPMIYYCDNNDGLIPLYDYSGKEAIKICKISYNSPIVSVIKGCVDSLLDLTIEGRRLEMEEEAHVARQIISLADGYASLAKAAQIINDDRTPTGVKMYAMSALNKLMDKQGKLNEQVGIRIDKIDTRI